MKKTKLSRKQLFLSGAKGVLPLVVASSPLSFIIGALSITCGFTVLQSTLMSFLVFAGSSQIAVLSLIQQHSGVLVILFTTLVINLRHVLYSASLSVYLKGYSFFTRACAAFGLTDEVFATGCPHLKANKDKSDRIYFYFGAMLTFWMCWVMVNFLGAVVGSSVPNIGNYGLEFVMVTSFTSIVVPQLKSQPMILAALTAGISAVILHSLPYQLGLVVASLLGIGSGVLMQAMLKPAVTPRGVYQQSHAGH